MLFSMNNLSMNNCELEVPVVEATCNYAKLQMERNFYSERQTKTRTGENPRDVRQIKPKMFSVPGSEKDPVAAYQLYAKKRPTEMNDSDAPFYLAINNCTKQESSKPWFKKSAVGQNKLNSLMRKMAEKAGLGPNVTNHSGRKTMIQALKDIPATDIIQLSGQKPSKCDKLFGCS